MRHVPRFSDDYGFDAEERADTAILSSDLDDMLEAIGDDWSISDAEELDVATIH